MAAFTTSVRSVRVLSKVFHGHVLSMKQVKKKKALKQGSSEVILEGRCPAEVSSTHLSGASGKLCRAPALQDPTRQTPAVRCWSQALSEGQRSQEPDVLYQRLSLQVKGHDRAVLDSFETFAALAARELGLNLERASTPHKHIDRFTLLKSVHIFKKHRVQYEMRTHYRCIEVARVTGSSAQVYLEYVQRNLPEGVAMEVTKTAIEKIPEHIERPLWDD